MSEQVEFVGIAQPDAAHLYAWLSSFLGTPVATELDVVRALERGIGTKAVDALAEFGLNNRDIACIVSHRSLQRRKPGPQALSLSEAERCIRVAGLLFFAEELFGDRTAALSWFRRPMHRLEGRSPVA